MASVMAGKDTLAILPTGGGKSLCYQLPALAMDGIGLVVSPLIALMQDQARALEQKGIPVAVLHAGLKPVQIERILEQASLGDYKLLYVSPERLSNPLFLSYLDRWKIALIAVDEAHCVSQWGHDFRPSYGEIHALRAHCVDVPLLALTASATQEVRDDIVGLLGMKDWASFVQSTERPNLAYHVRYSESKDAEMLKLFSAVRGSGIVYARSRRRCLELAALLKEGKVDAAPYHAGMPLEEREFVQRQWTTNERRVICATTAFGMGIDKPDVRLVAHYEAPLSLEEYYQEAGRAGRDGQKAHGVLFYNGGDLRRIAESTDAQYPDEAYLQKIYQLVGDYLRLPIGQGMEELFPFDALRFAQTFELDIWKTSNALRLLARQGFWEWEEQTGLEASLCFTTDRRTLSYLERQAPPLFYIANNLLRLYGAAFHHITSIDLFDAARALRIEKEQLENGLVRLASFGILEYGPAMKGGSLLWLRPRLSALYWRLDKKQLEKLRSAHRKRAQAMIGFLSDMETCRNVQLGHYFGNPGLGRCGHCDVCKRQDRERLGPREKNKEAQSILLAIRARGETTLQGLQQLFPEMEEADIADCVRKLADESLCRICASGTIFAATIG